MCSSDLEFAMLWVFLTQWADWFGGWCDLSGLANKKTVAVQSAADKEMTVVLSTTKSKKQNNPAAFSHKTGDSQGCAVTPDGQGCQEPGNSTRATSSLFSKLICDTGCSDYDNWCWKYIYDSTVM